MARLYEEKKIVLESMTREALFREARQLLEEGGWKGMTMEKLANLAGVAKGTVYNYFKDKNEVIYFVMDRTLEPALTYIRQIDINAENPEEIFTRVLKMICEGLYEDRFLIPAIVRAINEDENQTPADHEKKSISLWEIRRFMQTVLQKGTNKGQFKKMDPQTAEAVVHACIMGTLRELFVGNLDLDSEEFTKAIADFIYFGLKGRQSTGS